MQGSHFCYWFSCACVFVGSPVSSAITACMHTLNLNSICSKTCVVAGCTVQLWALISFPHIVSFYDICCVYMLIVNNMASSCKQFHLLFQAVANSTSATFLRVVGSELIQKYLGDGPKLVRELFRVADDLSPSIVFIDEIDAVGTKR